MQQQTLPWIIALVAIITAVPMALWFWLRPSKPAKPKPLPTEWALTGRPIFSTDERRVYRQLREALPHHIVLSKLPLVRFCQPNDPQQVRYWYELLGGIHVTFAICSANGRVLAAIDLATERNAPSRAMQIKQSVLAACRVRYLRCPVDHLPSVPELQMLVPQSAASTRGPQPAPAVYQARDTLATVVASRRRERTTLWQDSGFFHDSFFAPERRRDAGNSVMDSLSPASTLGAPVSSSHTDGPPTQPPDLSDAEAEALASRYSSQARH
ncbi:MAG: DUF2726 domain-containing protein [Burkholderiales bacterium]|nr:DUF2726 domain-containing protein [Burkholderiales bacterium]